MGWGNDRLFQWSTLHDQYGRHAHIYSSLEPKGSDIESWYVVYVCGYSTSTKFVQMMTLG